MGAVLRLASDSASCELRVNSPRGGQVRGKIERAFGIGPNIGIFGYDVYLRRMSVTHITTDSHINHGFDTTYFPFPSPLGQQDEVNPCNTHSTTRNDTPLS